MRRNTLYCTISHLKHNEQEAEFLELLNELVQLAIAIATATATVKSSLQTHSKLRADRERDA